MIIVQGHIMDFDLSLDDILLSAYRLSWPGPVLRPSRRAALRRLVRDAVGLCRRQRFHGWTVPLSAPAV